MLTRQAILDLFLVQRAGATTPANVQSCIGEFGAFALMRYEPAATVVAMTTSYAALANWTSSDSRGTGWTINKTSGQFTIPVDDWYQVGFNAVHTEFSGTTTARPFLNGTAVPGIQTGSTVIQTVIDFGTLSFVAPVYCLAGQLLDLRCNNTVNQGVTLGPTVFWLSRMF